MEAQTFLFGYQFLATRALLPEAVKHLSSHSIPLENVIQLAARRRNDGSTKPGRSPSSVMSGVAKLRPKAATRR